MYFVYEVALISSYFKMSAGVQEYYIGVFFLYMRKYRLEVRSEIVLDTNDTVETE